MEIGNLDLDVRFDYLIIYKDKKRNLLNTWTLDVFAFEFNYKQMIKCDNVEILGVYRKLKDNQLNKIINK